MTANILPGARLACQQAGVNDYILKPIVSDELIRVLKRWLPDTGDPTASRPTVIHQPSLAFNLREDPRPVKEEVFSAARLKSHFLFNTLNAIANICDQDDNPAGSLILDLAEYLRIELEDDHGNEWGPLKHELDFTAAYLRLEQARFGSRISVDYEVTAPLYQDIPRLMIKPLVENAVRHGIARKPAGGTVTIRVLEVSKGLRVVVEDDGVGMPPEVWNAALQPNRQFTHPSGLQTINQRLLSLFGEGLDISSQEGEGTRVFFIMPFRRNTADVRQGIN